MKNFFTEIEAARDHLGFQYNEECLYRGHADGSWPLLPTLLRHCHLNNITEIEKVRYLDANLFWEFQARARELHSQSLSSWDALFFMRHHGVATRLLDCTEVLGIAIWFAIGNETKTSNPCIWLLNPYRLNEHKLSWDYRDIIAPQYLEDYEDLMATEAMDFSWEYPVTLYPIQKSARLHAQRGYFTIHGSRLKPLEKLYQNAVSKVIIPDKIIDELKCFLDVAGINGHSLFPDLDYLAKYLHKKYSIIN